ncbi:MAG: hypothetical protein V4820_11775 [Pseudomonadota bacterium]
MRDPEIAEALGWTRWRLTKTRKDNGIRPKHRDTRWTPYMLEQIKLRYVDGGECSSVVAVDLGVPAPSLTRKARNMGLARTDVAKLQNKAKANRKRSQTAAVKRDAKPGPEFVRTRQHPAFFAPPTRLQDEPLSDRILRELSAKPLSCPSLATLLGVNERLVSLQLSFFAHEGRVEAGPVGDRGLRYRVWSVVDQSSAVAQIAASLRCGPDSLVVAGEAA